jgi:hypothetical protein
MGEPTDVKSFKTPSNILLQALHLAVISHSCGGQVGPLEVFTFSASGVSIFSAQATTHGGVWHL